MTDPVLARALVRAQRKARESLAANVRTLRVAAGLSQARLADLAGCSLVWASAIERAQAPNPTLALVASLAHALECTPDRLLVPAAAPVRRNPGRPRAARKPS